MLPLEKEIGNAVINRGKKIRKAVYQHSVHTMRVTH